MFFIQEKTSSFLMPSSICNDLEFKPGYCFSTSGGLYVEQGAPAIRYNAISIIEGKRG